MRHVVLADPLAHQPHPAPGLRGADGGRAHDGVLQALDVVRVDQEGAAEFVGRAGELAQHQRAALVVAAGDVLLGHQVHPVPQRGHQHDVGGQVQRRHLLPVVRLVQVVHGRAAHLRVLAVDPAHGLFNVVAQHAVGPDSSRLGLATWTRTTRGPSRSSRSSSP